MLLLVLFLLRRAGVLALLFLLILLVYLRLLCL